MFEETRTETVDEQGMIHVRVLDARPGERVQVTVRKDAPKAGGWPTPEPREPDAQGRYRTIGGLEGKIRIAPDFDDPLPEMEPYS